jgi:hypothetical protein
VPATRRGTVDGVSDEPCWTCGAAAHVFRIECPECARRSEDAECRALRERLFSAPPAERFTD